MAIKKGKLVSRPPAKKTGKLVQDPQHKKIVIKIKKKIKTGKLVHSPQHQIIKKNVDDVKEVPDAEYKEDDTKEIRDEVHEDVLDEMDNVDDVQDAVVMSKRCCEKST